MPPSRKRRAKSGKRTAMTKAAASDSVDLLIAVSAHALALPTQPISFIGLPVVAAPVPLEPLPIAVQIIAAPWREDVALRIAYALEAQGVVAAPRPEL